MRILIVDDEMLNRKLTAKALSSFGHEVITAADGVEALEILEHGHIGFIISDWVMPRMDGLELCRKIRAANFPRYTYIILLTAKGEKSELVRGMEAGADDFISKPFDKQELNVRVRAGERVLNLERDLEERNTKLSHAYAVMRNDLEAAAKMQMNLLPASPSFLAGILFQWRFLPCAFLAGDILNFFLLDKNHVGFYLLDVAGHGVPAAMMSVTVSKIVTPIPLQSNLLRQVTSTPPYYNIASPAAALHKLNQFFQNEMDAMQYFTMIYGIINIETGKMSLCQAGHPPPILLKKNGTPQLIGGDSFPVGMLAEAEYDEQQIVFEPGDRLLLYSDGVTECRDREGRQFNTSRLLQHVEEFHRSNLDELLRGIENRLRDWRGQPDFEDDVTVVVMENNGDDT